MLEDLTTLFAFKGGDTEFMYGLIGEDRPELNDIIPIINR